MKPQYAKALREHAESFELELLEVQGVRNWQDVELAKAAIEECGFALLATGDAWGMTMAGDTDIVVKCRWLD